MVHHKTALERMRLEYFAYIWNSLEHCECGQGGGTKNAAEFQALSILGSLVLEMGVRDIQVFGDSN